MKVLVIDDVRTLKYPATHARTIEEAERLLDESWDEVWFDYDMGEGQDMLPLLWKIREGDVVVNAPTIYVHTSNPVGREYILDALKDQIDSDIYTVPTIHLKSYFDAE